MKNNPVSLGQIIPNTTPSDALTTSMSRPIGQINLPLGPINFPAQKSADLKI